MLLTVMALRFPFFHQSPEVPRQEVASDRSATDENGDRLSQASDLTNSGLAVPMPQTASKTNYEKIMTDAAQLMTLVDADHDHNMGKDEISNFLQVPGREAYKTVLTEFDYFDDNRNEALNVDELANLMVFANSHPISLTGAVNEMEAVQTKPVQSQHSAQTQSAVAPPLLPPFPSQGRPGTPAHTEPVSKQSVAQLALSDLDQEPRAATAVEPVVQGYPPAFQAQTGAQAKAAMQVQPVTSVRPTVAEANILPHQSTTVDSKFLQAGLKVVQGADADQDGSLSMEEVTQLVQSPGQEFLIPVLSNFHVFDKDGSATLDAVELAHILEALSK